jgi:hypothetical protein
LCDAVLNLLMCCYINHAVWFVHCRALHTMFYIFGSILHLCVRTNGIPLKVWPLAPIVLWAAIVAWGRKLQLLVWNNHAIVSCVLSITLFSCSFTITSICTL